LIKQVAGAAQFEGNCMLVCARQEACMDGEKHLGAELLTVVDALRGTLDDARRQLDHARQMQRAVTSLACRTLRQRDLGDGFIRQLLDLDDDVFAEAVHADGPMIAEAQDWQVRAELEQLWTTVRRRASVWFQTDDLETSCDVIRHNGIDTESWPLSIDELDTPGAEFVHQISGQKIVVYSLQGRNGTPTVVDGRIRSWDSAGVYKVEFVSQGAARSRLDMAPFGLLPRDNSFNSHRGDGAEGAFGVIVAAIRRDCGPLPPFAEATRLMTTEPSP
jgi:hypothetical protein